MTFDKIRIGTIYGAVKKAPEELRDDILKVLNNPDYGVQEVKYSRDIFNDVYKISIDIIGCLENKMEELGDNIMEEIKYNIIKTASDAGYGVQEIRYSTNKITVEIVGCLKNGEGILVFIPMEEEK